jgi:hypothetical protein
VALEGGFGYNHAMDNGQVLKWGCEMLSNSRKSTMRLAQGVPCWAKPAGVRPAQERQQFHRSLEQHQGSSHLEIHCNIPLVSQVEKQQH